MLLPLYIARRYLFSKKTHNVINIISAVSVAGICTGTMALIVVMSAFNGLEKLVQTLYSSFDPDIKITVKEGKTFDISRFPEEKIRQIKGVKYYCEALEESVYMEFRNNESLATIKGVEKDFLEMSGLDSMLSEGELVLKSGENNFAVLGYGIAQNLGLPYLTSIDRIAEPLKVFSARKEAKSVITPDDAFSSKLILPSGIFALNQDFDMKYVLVPLDFARDLLQSDNRASSVELGLEAGTDEKEVKKQIVQLLGDAFIVKTQFEQNEIIYNTNQTEKWITYLILTFILVIATFNLIGSLTMLILDKKKDLLILKSMGANNDTIKKIFISEGMMIAMSGGGIGLFLGAILCLCQQMFGFVELQGIIVDRYPVELSVSDFVIVLATVLVIGYVASWLPVRYVTKRYL